MRCYRLAVIEQDVGEKALIAPQQGAAQERSSELHPVRSRPG